jgi:hypothetical protein
MENVHGREVVEAGNLCERKNGRGVDTNRNWDLHWGFRERDYDPSEEYGGTHPFRYRATPRGLMRKDRFLTRKRYKAITIRSCHGAPAG